MVWFKKFGFRKNPFDVNTLKTKFKIIGREFEAKEIIYRIASGSMLLIEGKSGFGKTALLKHAIDNFKGKGKVVYVDASSLNKRLDIAKLIYKKPKGMIILLDNVQYLSKKNNDKIKYYYDQDRIKSVVFTTNSYELVNFSDSIIDRIGNNVIKLKNLSQSYVVELARGRLAGFDIISDTILKKIYSNAKNIKEFLLMCNSLGEYLADEGKQTANLYDLKHIDTESFDKLEINGSGVCDNCGADLIKIGGYWRCENCDQYCLNCGALVEEKDSYCPECGVEFEEESE